MAVLLVPGGAAASDGLRHDDVPQWRLGELLADNWEAIFAIPAAENPLLGVTGPAADARRCVELKPYILAPIGTATCDVKSGTRVFLWYSNECSAFEIGTDSALRQAICAIKRDYAAVDRLLVTVDGVETNIRTWRYEVLSRQREVDIPADNVFGAAPLTTTFVAHGWAVLTRPLRTDTTITVEVEGTNPVTSTIVVNVV